MSIDINLSSSVFLDELFKLSTDIVWKNQTEANKYESSDFSIITEIFMAAGKGLITFESIYRFDYDILVSLGLTDDQINAAIDDKYYIPENLRNAATRKYIEKILLKDPETGRYVNYEERNNYYRMLNGLPDIEDTEFIYNTKYTDIPMDTPIHLMSITDRYTLENRGYLDELITQYPSKKYIKYLASKNIDIYVARSSERFSILYMNSSEYQNLYEDFQDIYDKCRYNIIRVYYSDVFRKDNSLYDGFMAMCILFMTIQLMHFKYLDVDITRDFYDLESIRYIYESYGVPFYSSIPLEYHKKVVKNINRLISYKGSTRVFFDLFDLFDYGSMDIFEYYLLKTRRFENGKPITVLGEDEQLDKRAMYEIKFGKVRLYDDPPLELVNPENHIDYTTMTSLDPYWISDEELLDKLYDTDFNYLETKYIGIQTLFDLMQIMYESAYFFKMILDNKKALNAVTLMYAPIGRSVNIFELCVYVAALICKKYGYQGNISSEYPFVSKVLGFNFKENLSTVKKEIVKNSYLSKDTKLDKLLSGININNINSINSTFSTIQNLRQHFIDKKYSCKTREEYFAYDNLEKTLMTSEIIEDVYKKKDKTLAKSFEDLIKDSNGELYVRLIREELDLDDEIDNVLVLLKKTFPALKYIEWADGIDISNLIEHLFKLLNFFKSAKAELTGYNIIYAISARGINYFKLISTIDRISESAEMRDYSWRYLTDILEIGKFLYTEKSRFKALTDKNTYHSLSLYYKVIDQLDKLTDMIWLYQEFIKDKYSELSLVDYLHTYISNDLLKSFMPLEDENILVYEDREYIYTIQRIKDKFDKFIDMIHNIMDIHEPIIDKLLINYKDRINEVLENVELFYDKNQLNNVYLIDLVKIICKEVLRDRIYSLTVDKLFDEEFMNQLISILNLSDLVVSTDKDSFTNNMELLDNIKQEILKISINDALLPEDRLELVYSSIIERIAETHRISSKFSMLKSMILDISSHSNIISSSLKDLEDDVYIIKELILNSLSDNDDEIILVDIIKILQTFYIKSNMFKLKSNFIPESTSVSIKKSISLNDTYTIYTNESISEKNEFSITYTDIINSFHSTNTIKDLLQTKERLISISSGLKMNENKQYNDIIGLSDDLILVSESKIE